MTNSLSLSIKEVTRRTGLSAHALRDYEKLGLTTSINRASGGSRRYTEEDVAWIQFLTRLRNTGMPIRLPQWEPPIRNFDSTSARHAMLD